MPFFCRLYSATYLVVQARPLTCASWPQAKRSQSRSCHCDTLYYLLTVLYLVVPWCYSTHAVNSAHVHIRNITRLDLSTVLSWQLVRARSARLLHPTLLPLLAAMAEWGDDHVDFSGPEPPAIQEVQADPASAGNAALAAVPAAAQAALAADPDAALAAADARDMNAHAEEQARKKAKKAEANPSRRWPKRPDLRRSDC